MVDIWINPPTATTILSWQLQSQGYSAGSYDCYCCLETTEEDREVAVVARATTFIFNSLPIIQSCVPSKEIK